MIGTIITRKDVLPAEIRHFKRRVEIEINLIFELMKEN